MNDLKTSHGGSRFLRSDHPPMGRILFSNSNDLTYARIWDNDSKIY
ncbi:hypothetical protein BLAT2472_50080 [Burkholderia latens]